MRANDLVDMVDDLIEIDRYKPKLGADSEIIVVALKANSLLAAKDLGSFLEWSRINIEDVEVSDASDVNGKFHVYLELKRLPGLVQKIIEIIQDVEHITGSQQWKFVSLDGTRNDLSIGELNVKVVQDPRLYDIPPESRSWYLRMKHLTSY